MLDERVCAAMTMEAAAGKNPVSHVGKLYNLIAGNIARGLVDDVAGVAGATCLLVSQIGCSLDDPQLADVQFELGNADAARDVQANVMRVVSRHIEGAGDLLGQLLQERLLLY